MGETKEKKLKAKVVHKHETSANWELSNYIPDVGEIVFYDPDEEYNYTRQKNGDGVHKVSELPFTEAPVISGEADNSVIQKGDASSDESKNFVNRVYAVAGTAFGYNNIAGSKGYRILNFTPGEQDEAGNYINGTYTLDITNEETIPNEIIGKLYSIYLKQTKDRVGTISAINGNVLTVDGFLYPAKWDEGEWEELDEEGNKTGNTLTGEAWEEAKAEAYASSYIIFEGLPTIGNILVGTGAHVEGWGNIATQIGSHAEGAQSQALGKYSHAEGDATVAYYSAHSEGKYAVAEGYHSHAENYRTLASGQSSHAEGTDTVASGHSAHAEGCNTDATGKYAHAEGNNTTASGVISHAEGFETNATNSYSHSEGYKTNATGNIAHAEGSNTTASGQRAHAEGLSSVASGNNSHAEGSNTVASAENAHAEGVTTKASGNHTHAEGQGSQAIGGTSHAEGSSTKTYGAASHAEGQNTVAYGNYSHVGGMNSTAGTTDASGQPLVNSGLYAFSHGYQTHARGKGSVALGRDTIAAGDYETVFGAFNDTTKTNVAHAIGIGTSETARRNGLTVYKDGRVEAGADPKNDLDLATKQYVDSKDDAIVILDWTSEMSLEDIQALIDDVRGDLVLNINNYNAYGVLNFSSNIRSIYLGGDSSPFVTYQGPGKSSGTSIFYSNGWVVENCEITDFNYVYNMWPAGYIRNCGVVQDSYAQYEIDNCDLLIRSAATSFAGSSGNLNISNCKMIVDFDIGLDMLNYQVTISNCEYINNVKITNQERGEYDESSDDWYIHFNDCKFVSNVWLAPGAHSDFDIQYNDCEFVDNLTVYRAPNFIDKSTLVDQNDLTAINTKINTLANNIIPKQTTKITLTDEETCGGWYRIAQSSNIKTVSGIFKITTSLQSGGKWSEIIFIASKAFNADGSVKILNHQKHTNGIAIDKIRVAYLNNTASTPAYIDVHCVNSGAKTVTMTVELLENVNTTNDTGDKWILLAATKESTTEPWTIAKQFLSTDIDERISTLEAQTKTQIVEEELPANPDANTIYFIV